jgi:endonuclease/exonuclease/phosphatase family metal-dependent hydrolase
VNIYAPSGAEKRGAKEDFYTLELPYRMRTTPSRMILGGDFNCVLTQTDCRGKGNYSRALQQLVRGYDLVDVWEAKTTSDVYTHYTSQGATGIDRLYITRNICESKRGVDTLATAMTDHLAVVLRMVWEAPEIHRGTGYWKMNVTLLKKNQSETK